MCSVHVIHNVSAFELYRRGCKPDDKERVYTFIFADYSKERVEAVGSSAASGAFGVNMSASINIFCPGRYANSIAWASWLPNTGYIFAPSAKTYLNGGAALAFVNSSATENSKALRSVLAPLLRSGTYYSQISLPRESSAWRALAVADM